MAKFFKPNMSLISAQAAAIKDRMNQFTDRKILWYDWLTEGEDGSDGMNYLRVLPPWSELGLIAVVTYKWELPHTRDTYRQLRMTWPERGIEDPIEAVCRRLVIDYPFLAEQIKDEVGTRTAAFLNVIDRRHEELGPLVCWTPGSVYNWYVSQMELMRQYGVDTTDIEQGVDCAIKRSPNIKNWYDTQFMGTLSPQGFTPTLSPLHADPKVREEWTEKLWALDKIIHFPDDERLAKQQECADNLRLHYEVQARRQLSTPPPAPAGGMPNPIAQQVAGIAQSFQQPAPQAAPAPVYAAPPPQMPMQPAAVPMGYAPQMQPAPAPQPPMQAPAVIPPQVPVQSWAPPAVQMPPQAQPAPQPIPVAPQAAPSPIGASGYPLPQVPAPGLATNVQGPIIPPSASPMPMQPTTIPRPAPIPPVGATGPAPVAGPPMAQTAPGSPLSRPPCFQDHQAGFAKCMMCPVEFDCIATVKQAGRRPYAWNPAELPNPQR